MSTATDVIGGDRARPRLSGARVAIALIVIMAVALVAAIARWKSTRWPEGDVLAVAGAGTDQVVYALRASAGNYWGYLVLADRAKGPRWDAALYGMQSTASPVTIAPGLALVRGLDPEGHLDTYAFRLDDGVFQWRGARAREGAEPFRGVGTFVIGTRVVEIYGGAIAEAIILDLTGHELGRTTLPFASEALVARRAGEGVEVSGGLTTMFVDLEGNARPVRGIGFRDGAISIGERSRVLRAAIPGLDSLGRVIASSEHGDGDVAIVAADPSGAATFAVVSEDGVRSLPLGLGEVVIAAPLIGETDGWLPLLVRANERVELLLVSLGETALASERVAIAAEPRAELEIVRVADKPSAFVVRVGNDLLYLAPDATIAHGTRVRGDLTALAVAPEAKQGRGVADHRLWLATVDGTRLLSLPELRAVRSFSAAPALHLLTADEIREIVRPAE